MRSRVQSPPEALGKISLEAFKIKVLEESYSVNQTKSLSKLSAIFSKNIYKNPQEFFQEFKNNLNSINETESSKGIVKKLLNYLKNQGISEELINNHKKLIKKSNDWKPDNFVPTDKEILLTLSKLRKDLLPIYLLFLFSGIRVSEGKYLLNNLDSLKVQCLESYYKVYLDYNRHNKNVFFCYIPAFLFNQIKEYKHFSMNIISLFIKRNNLIPLKYCRKWFYTKCIEHGIPESIADFYEGRVATSVGANHYLSRQLLADKYYPKAEAFFKVFLKLKEVLL